MKNKTRKFIGSVLVWIGIIVIFFANLAIHGLTGYFLPNSTITLNFDANFWIINLGIAALLVGGLWGMKE